MSQSSEQKKSLSPLKSALLAVEKMRARLEAIERSKSEPIAIIGLGCRFPGRADTPEAFWRLLNDGMDAVTEIPANRWDVSAFYDARPEAQGKMYTRSGSFLEDIDQFDSGFFGISPREATSMDPQQRLLLEVSWEALENGGCAPDRLAGSQTGVFIGICNRDYAESYDGAIDATSIDAYSGTGNIFSVAAGRLAYTLGLTGPALAVDTACSSSLVAIHLACQSLRQKECEMALAGGVNLILSPLSYIFLARAKAISADGRCRTFDADATGYGRGEGCGVVVLKRLSDAVAAGDRILATIRGSAVNHDGRSSGLTVPNGTAQQRLLRRALENAGVSPHEVSYVETHGTGTPLGDPIEVGAIATVLGTGRPHDRPLLIGSVKTNIGHLEAAAGVASLIKVVLSFSHDQIPRHLHLNKLNPLISQITLPVVVAAEPVPWPSGNGPRIAGVSAFGLSGTNAHLVIEQSSLASPGAPVVESPFEILTLSAKSDVALLASARRFATYLQNHPGVSFHDVCYTSNVGRSHFANRLAVIAASTAEARESLCDFIAGQSTVGLFHESVPGHAQPNIAFVFGGEADEIVHIGRHLYETASVFREILVRCNDLLQADLEQSLLSVLDPAPGTSAPLHEPAYSRAALVAIEYALAQLWRAWGVEPKVVMGYGAGEYAAASFAGILTLESALKLAVQPCQSDIRTTDVEFAPQRIPIVSSVLGASDSDLIYQADYWQDQSRRAMKSPTMNFLNEQGCDLFLKIEPRNALPENRRGRSGLVSRQPFVDGDAGHLQTMAESLAQLYVRGLAIDWPAFHKTSGGLLVALPTYPFQRNSYWKGRALPRDTTNDTANRNGAGLRISNPLLGYRLESALQQILFHSRYSVALMPWLYDHRFYGSIIVAGATYLAGVIAGAVEAFKAHECILKDIAFPRPMFLLDENARLVNLILEPEGSRRSSFQVVSRDEAVEERDEEGQLAWKLHAAGRIEWGADERSENGWEDVPLGSIRKWQWESLSVDEFYRTGWDCGMQAGPSFKWIDRLWRRPSEALAEMVAPVVTESKSTVFELHPGLIDSCFQLLGACLPPMIYPPADGAIPVVAQVDSFRIVRGQATKRAWVHFRLRESPEALVRNKFQSDFRVFDDQGNLLFEVSGLHIHLVSHRKLLQHEMKQSTNWIHEIEWHEVPSPTSQLVPTSVGSWIFLCDDMGVGFEVAASVKNHGEHCVLVYPGESFERVTQEEYRLNPGSPEDFTRLLEEAHLPGVPCRGIVHLWSMHSSYGSGIAEGEFETASVLSLGSTLYLVQSLVSAGWEVPPRIWLVTQGAQATGDETKLCVTQSPLWGLGKVIALEHPEFKCVRVDLDPSRTSGQGALLFNEIWCGDREDDIAYRDGGRKVPRLVASVPLVTSANEHSLEKITESTRLFVPNASFLITGGLGWIGRSVARWMVSEGARQLILVTRSTGGPAVDQFLNELEELGACVRVLKADVSQYNQLAQVISDIDCNFPLRGVFHAAGVLDDGALLHLDTTRFSKVLSPKVQGAWNLHLLTQPLKLDFFILFSSVASILGSPGQGNYAAANAFLDAVAFERNRQGLPAISINWGPWSGGQGMAASLSESSERRWKQFGVDFIAPAEGLEILGQILKRKSKQVVVLPVDWSKFLQQFEAGAEPPFLSFLRQPSCRGEACADSDSPRSKIMSELERADPGDRPDLLIDHLWAQTCKVLRLSSSDPADPRAPLDDLGLDSLMAIELRNALQETLNCSLPATLLYDYRTLADLSEYLLSDTIGLEKRWSINE